MKRPSLVLPSLLILMVLLTILGACSSNQSKQGAAEGSEGHGVVPVSTSPNPNGDSELALFMRKMDDDLVAHKQQLKAGNFDLIDIDHRAMLIATPTKIDNQDEQYVSYANSYLETVEALKTAPKDSMISMHNQWVAKCIDCHNSFCNGPIVRIQKRRMPIASKP